MHLGKDIRLERIFDRDTHRAVIVPMDHGVTFGLISGLIDIRAAVSAVVDGGANAVLMHKGLVRCGYRGFGRKVGCILHISASTTLSPFPNAKALCASVEDALRLGADGVSVHLNLGDETEPAMLRDLGTIASRAMEWGVPLLAMVYARGPKIADEFDTDVVSHCARVGMELGADVVKVSYTGAPESFSRVVSACCIPVVIAGGPRANNTKMFLKMVRDSLDAGGAGVSVGRNIFQYKDPTALTRALHAVVHKGVSVNEALAIAGED